MESPFHSSCSAPQVLSSCIPLIWSTNTITWHRHRCPTIRKAPPKIYSRPLRSGFSSTCSECWGPFDAFSKKKPSGCDDVLTFFFPPYWTSTHKTWHYRSCLSLSDPSTPDILKTASRSSQVETFTFCVACRSNFLDEPEWTNDSTSDKGKHSDLWSSSSQKRVGPDPVSNTTLTLEQTSLLQNTPDLADDIIVDINSWDPFPQGDQEHK